MKLLDSRTDKGQSIYLMGRKFEARSKDSAEHCFQNVWGDHTSWKPRGLNCFVPLRGVRSKMFLRIRGAGALVPPTLIVCAVPARSAKSAYAVGKTKLKPSLVQAHGKPVRQTDGCVSRAVPKEKDIGNAKHAKNASHALNSAVGAERDNTRKTVPKSATRAGRTCWCAV